LLSHKVLRWLVPLFLIALFVSNATLALVWGIYQTLFIAQCLFYLLALLPVWLPIYRWWNPLTVPLYFCTLNAAALMSLIEVYRGRQYVVWETVRR
jgi:hypothetical protein